MAEYGSVRDRVAALAVEGRTLAEVKSALGDPERSPMSCRGFPWATVPELASQDHLDQRQEIK